MPTTDSTILLSLAADLARSTFTPDNLRRTTMHTPVVSSFIESIAHDGAQTLEVKMKNGSVYTHVGITPEKHAELMNADSIGRHYNTFIKNQYPHAAPPPNPTVGQDSER